MRHLPFATTVFSLVLGLAVLAYDYSASGMTAREVGIPDDTSPRAPSAPPARAPSVLPGMPLFGLVPAGPSPSGKSPGDAHPVAEGAALPPSQAGYTLYGIILTPRDSSRQAIIGENDADQRRYREGDKMSDGAGVRTIRRTDVVLERNGQLEALPLRKDAVADQGATPDAEVTQLPGQDDAAQFSPPPPPPLPLPTARSKPDPLAAIRRNIEARRAAAARGDGEPPLFQPPP